MKKEINPKYSVKLILLKAVINHEYNVYVATECIVYILRWERFYSLRRTDTYCSCYSAHGSILNWTWIEIGSESNHKASVRVGGECSYTSTFAALWPENKQLFMCVKAEESSTKPPSRRKQRVAGLSCESCCSSSQRCWSPERHALRSRSCSN